MDAKDKLAAAIAWAEDKGDERNFDPDFLYSLQEGLEKYGSLTDKQESALDNIIDRFRIPVQEYAP